MQQQRLTRSAQGRLRPGDIYTHCLHGFESSIAQENGSLHPSVAAAQARGVVFDIGHGLGGQCKRLSSCCTPLRLRRNSHSQRLSFRCIPAIRR